MPSSPVQPETLHARSTPVNTTSTASSAWSPLRYSLFRTLWIATIVSNIGTWMQNVGAAWMMTSIAPSPAMVALVQVATSLPVFLVGLPAGALADIVDRRALLLWTQGWMLAAAAGLGVVTLAGDTTPWLLLMLTFMLGLGSAMNTPAWQAIVPELVTRSELPAAVALNSVSFNVARAVGPALGGLVVAAAGAGVVFLLNAASFLGVLVVLYRWQRSPSQSLSPPEHVFGAMRAGLRYVHYAPALKAVLVRAGAFIVSGAALWALLPLMARQELGLGATGYGVLLGCLGVGALIGAAMLPYVRQRVSSDPLLAGATVLFAFVTGALAYIQHVPVLCTTMVLGGIAWTILMSTFTVLVQTAVPAWVRARALAIYMLVVQGGMAVGSALWGTIAVHTGITQAFLAATIGLVAGLMTMMRYRLQAGEPLDLTTSRHLREPAVVGDLHLEDGPVLVSIEYRINPERGRDFARAMRALRLIRRRDGAIQWGLFRDVTDQGRYVETFVVTSWAEHLRQHERMTVADREIQRRVHIFHLGDAPPQASHGISAYAQQYQERSEEVWDIK